MIHGHTISLRLHVIKTCRTWESIAYSSSVLCLPAIEWYITEKREKKKRERETVYGEEANRMISCYKLIFDTHYLMRELLMAEQCQRSHSRRSCCKTYPLHTSNPNEMFETFRNDDISIGLRIQKYMKFFAMSRIPARITHWWGKFIQVMFRLTFEVGWWKCNFTLALNATLESFNCECQPKMNVRVSLLCFLVVPGHFRKSKLSEWPNKLHFD